MAGRPLTGKLRELASSAVTLVCLFVYIDAATNGQLHRDAQRAARRLHAALTGRRATVEPSPAEVSAMHEQARAILREAAPE